MLYYEVISQQDITLCNALFCHCLISDLWPIWTSLVTRISVYSMSLSTCLNAWTRVTGFTCEYLTGVNTKADGIIVAAIVLTIIVARPRTMQFQTDLASAQRIWH